MTRVVDTVLAPFALACSRRRRASACAGVALCALRARRGDTDRRTWLALTAALGLWTLGNTYWNAVLYTAQTPPFPSPADAGWLLFYPFAYLCLGLHARRTARELPPSMWLDGLVGVLAVAAVGIVVLIAPLTRGQHVSTGELIFGSANGILDLLLLSLVIAFVGLGGGGRGLRRLTEYGAMTAQGYLIARPMPAVDLEAWLGAGGFVLRAVADDEDVERARPVDALHAVQLDVGRR